MLDLNEIKAACEAATSGPWQCGPLTGGYWALAFQWSNDLLCSQNREADANFCVKARTWVPALVEELERARAEIERLEQYVPMKHLEAQANDRA